MATLKRWAIHAILLPEYRLHPSDKSSIFPHFAVARVDRPNCYSEFLTLVRKKGLFINTTAKHG